MSQWKVAHLRRCDIDWEEIIDPHIDSHCQKMWHWQVACDSVRSQSSWHISEDVTLTEIVRCHSEKSHTVRRCDIDWDASGNVTCHTWTWRDGSRGVTHDVRHSHLCETSHTCSCVRCHILSLSHIVSHTSWDTPSCVTPDCLHVWDGSRGDCLTSCVMNMCHTCSHLHRCESEMCQEVWHFSWWDCLTSCLQSVAECCSVLQCVAMLRALRVWEESCLWAWETWLA